MPRYSKHAQDRMSQRGIKKAWVQMCLEKPDVTVESSSGLRQYLVTRPDGRRLKVVLDPDKDIVISAMWQ